MHLHALHVSMGTHAVCNSVNPGVNKTTMTGDIRARACDAHGGLMCSAGVGHMNIQFLARICRMMYNHIWTTSKPYYFINQDNQTLNLYR
jgi:hypothetical protein